MRFLITRNMIIKEFAMKIADLQMRSDKEYYKPHLKNYKPKRGENDHATWLLDQVIPLKEMCQKLGIVKQVYSEAYKIYDFRNSGKSGYGLVNGKIQKIEMTEEDNNECATNKNEQEENCSIDNKIKDMLWQAESILNHYKNESGSEDPLDVCLARNVRKHFSSFQIK